MLHSPAFWIATACFGFILYVLAGYPAWLGWRTRGMGTGRSVRAFRLGHCSQSPWEPSVSVILPVANGERWLAAKLDSILALDYPSHLLDIIVIADGSTDATESIARTYSNRRVRLFSLPAGGKALALNRGIAEASGEVLFFTDVRQKLEPQCLRRMLATLVDPATGVVSGELVILDGATLQEASTGLYWKYEKWIRTRLSMLDSVLGATGCIYVMKRHLATPLPPATLLDDMFLPLAAFFRGYRVRIEPGAIAYDLPTTLDAEFRRKVRTLAGNYQIMAQYPALLGPSNRMWIHFVSHKLGRLLLPHALIVLAAATCFLRGPALVIFALPQILIYGLAAIDPLIPVKSPLQRLTAPARTFVVLMAAAFWAISYFFTSIDNFWKPTR